MASSKCAQSRRRKHRHRARAAEQRFKRVSRAKSGMKCRGECSNKRINMLLPAVRRIIKNQKHISILYALQPEPSIWQHAILK